ncbi:MAG: amidohydrolase [Oscillospiraceae bacterium]|nr:amidohydrolase [Oscillospiraceae bacterium]
MLFEKINITDENFELKTDMYVRVESGKISSITEQRPEDYEGECYNGEGKLLMPGLVNSHSHLPMTLTRGYGDGLTLQSWLFDKIFPFEDQMTDEDAYIGTMLGIAEMLASGTTSVSDMYMFGESVCRAALESGIKCNFSRCISSGSETPLEELKGFKEAMAVKEKYDGANNGRIRVDYSIHAEYTSSEYTIGKFADYVNAHDARVSTHISETKTEHEECKARHNGLTPVQYFEKMGIFGTGKAFGAHCVWIEPEDREIMAKNGVMIAHCPSSNMKLGSGLADVKAMLDAGITVGIGTDGAGSNNNLDMFEEMHLAALTASVKNYDAAAFSAKDVLKMATVNGALMQGRTDCGLIKEGYCADLVVVDLEKPHLTPKNDIVSSLVYSAGGQDVVLTMVDGEVLYRDGKFTTIDIDEIMKLADKAVCKIKSRL